MQDITPIIPEGRKIIQAYGNGGFTVNGEKINSAIFITQDSLVKINASNLQEINQNFFAEIGNILSEQEIMLVGYGTNSDFFPAEIEKFLRDKKISIDYINSGAACRTYNILLSEERKVCAIIIPV